MARLRMVRVVIGTLLFASCAAAPSKYGGDIAPVELRAASGSLLDTPGGDVLARWAEQASAQSHGAVSIVVEPAPDESADADGVVLRRLRDGDLDVGVVRAAAFTSAGVTSFQALQAPFLVDNDELAALVSTDPVAEQMLEGLDAVDLVGLALVPGGLRHPVGWNRPLLSLADFQGAEINTRPSPDLDRLFSALGASTEHSVGQERVKGAASGALRGLEMSLLIHPNAGAPAVLTGNVVLYVKFDVVVMRRRTFDSLSVSQRDALSVGLDNAVADAMTDRPSEQQAAQTWCSLAGQAIVAASPDDVLDLQRAAGRLVEALRRDTLTRKVIDRVRALASGTVQTALPPCAGPPDAAIGVVAHGDQSLLNGTWRFETSEQDLLDVGVPPDEVSKDVGVHTYVLRDGRMEGGKEGEYCTGSYVLDGPRIAWTFDPTSCGGAFQAEYDIDDDRLDLDIDPLVQEGWFFRGYMKHGWVRIGGTR